MADAVDAFLTLAGNLAPTALGAALGSGDAELQPLLLTSVSALYVASAIGFVYAGEAEGLKACAMLVQVPTRAFALNAVPLFKVCARHARAAAPCRAHAHVPPADPCMCMPCA